MTKTIFDLDTQRNQCFYDSGYSGYSGTPSPVSSISSGMIGSPMSQASDLAAETQYLTVADSQVSTFYDLDTNRQVTPFNFNAQDSNRNLYDGAKLVIIEQPVEKFRFRYKSEMHGTHGSLMGSRTEKSKKTYPTVELQGYNGVALILCSLYQTDSLNPMPHSHRLVVRDGDVDRCDPHELTVSPQEGYRAVFQGMGIIHTAKKHIVDELRVKLKREKIMETGGVPLTSREDLQINAYAEKIARNMNLNQVCLGFQAFAVNGEKSLTRICPPIFSRPINNMKSALTGELKITRLSAAVSSAAGGDDLFLFVEKVGKKNIKVRFFELDDNDEEVWEGWGIFSEADVHHQYAIALRTPPYKDKDIDQHKEVYIQLVRPSDNDRSEPMPFKYKPRDVVTSRKRARMSSSTFSSAELPETIVSNFNNQQSISSEFNKHELLRDFLGQVSMDFNSGELEKIVADSNGLDLLTTDGASNKPERSKELVQQRPSVVVSRASVSSQKPAQPSQHIFQIYSLYRQYGDKDPKEAQEKILSIFDEANANDSDIIHTAIRTDDSNNMIKLLKLIDKLQLNEVLQYRNERKETCLHIVCLFDKPQYIRPLINLGANPNFADNRGNTPLHIAIEENMAMCASRIIDPQNYTKKSVQLHIDCANDEGLTPLHLAVMKRDLPMVERLLKTGNASTKLCVSKSGNNALHLAIERNDLFIVEYLLNNTSINVNEPNLSGFTPLRLAKSMESISKEIIQLLIKHGATEGDSKVLQVQNKRIDISTRRNKMDTNETSSTEDEDDDDENPLTIDERYDSDESDLTSNVLFDKESIKMLADIYNENGKWKKLANQLKLDRHISFWSAQPNPAAIMLNHINNMDKDRKTKLRDVINAVYAIRDLDTIKLIHRMQERRL